MLLANITLGDLLWSIIAVFFLVVYIMILVSILADLFRDHETSGFVKFLWILSFIILPYLGMFIYLIVRGGGMAQRSMAAQAEAQQQFNKYVQDVAGSAGNPAEQIAQAKQLLDAGTISQEEFDAIKAKALA